MRFISSVAFCLVLFACGENKNLGSANYQDENFAIADDPIAVPPDPALITNSPTTELVSVGLNGLGLNGQYTDNPSVSEGGHYVAFYSDDSNIVPNDTNGVRDIFVSNMLLGTIERVSVDSNETEANGISDHPNISMNAKRVAFSSWATNLVPNDTNGVMDIFLRDMITGTTSRVSVSSNGTEANAWSLYPSISRGGEFVAFQSSATNLVTGDVNGAYDVFVHDVENGITTMASVNSSGQQGNAMSGAPSISLDGRYVAFVSNATNLVAGDTNNTTDVFVHDTDTGITKRVSVATGNIQANSFSSSANISADGRYVVFSSTATNLVANDNNGRGDIFIHDSLTQTTQRVSVSSNGVEGNGVLSGLSYSPAVSSDGRYVVFNSHSDNLVPGDTNQNSDVFIRDRLLGTTTMISVSDTGLHGNHYSGRASISTEGHYVVFTSYSSNLTLGVSSCSYQNIFIRNLAY